MMPFSDEEIYRATKYNLSKISTYISSHGGDIRLLGVKSAIVYIELTGACHGCAMSLMTTKMVVQEEFRKLIHPEIKVINVDGMPGNELPKDCYKEEEPLKETRENGLINKIKKFFKL